ncbi:MAG: two-component regulator propeller domain-containing protein [Bacteroidales bacterium]
MNDYCLFGINFRVFGGDLLNIRLIKGFIFGILFLFILNNANAERINIDHYSVNDGLSENTVVSMFQDRKGIMWFGTFAGLNRFDGYNFRTYKAAADNRTGLSHNRVDYITEDSYGFLWLITYSGQVQRFDPRKEEFMSVPDCDVTLPHNTSPITRLYSFTGGDIWLVTKNNGAYRVLTDPIDFSLTIQHFGKEHKSVNTDYVHAIYKDWKKNIWLLTDNGLVQINLSESVPNHFFEENQETKRKDSQSFFSSVELDEEILFGSAHGRIWCYNKKQEDFKLYSLPLPSDVLDIKELTEGRFLVLTSHTGFAIYTPATDEVISFCRKTHPQMKSDEMISSYLDQKGDVWIETTANGVLHLDPVSGKLDNFEVVTDKTSPYILLPNFRIFEDKRSRLWVHPRGGGFSYYDREANELRPFYNEPGSPDRKFSNLLHTAMTDMQGNLWMCTYSKGLEKVNFLRSEFDLVQPNPQMENGLYENEIRALYQDSDSVFWVSTKDASLYLMDKNFRKLGYIGEKGKLNKDKPFPGIVYSILEDHKGRIWLGTKGMGVFVLEKESVSGCYSVKNYAQDPDDIYSLSHDAVYSLLEDEKQNIWIGTFGGGINLVDQSGDRLRFLNHRNNLRSYPISKCQKIRKIATDSLNNIWIATSNGIVTFKNDFQIPANIVFKHITSHETANTGISYDVHYIVCTSKKELFFATYGAGLNKLVSYEDGKPVFMRYSKATGAPSDIILNLMEDPKGNLWMSSANGLLSFTPKTEQFTTYSINEGLDCADFSEASILKLSDNRIGVGSNVGIYVFDPTKLRKKQFVPPLVFTDFQLFNKTVHANDDGSPLKEAIDYTEKITLNHDQSVFSIGFAALDMENSRNMEYKYRMRGFEKEWNILRGVPRVTYTNLPKGEYVFEVKSTNSDGIWVDNGREIKIEILPSFWNSNWGYLLYIAGILLLLGLIFYLQFVFFKLKNKVTLEQHMSNLKLRFFTDISHELRTPLTLIASPVEYLVKQTDLSPVAREQLEMVQRNVDRMLRLVNQILDFRKIQNNKMKLKIERIHIGDFASQVCESFMSLASDKEIRFRFTDHSDGINIWADKDKVEKILFNLLANAFKFTPAGKTIEVELTRNEQSVSIRIQDEGVGMGAEKLTRLFERFDSADNYEGFQPGTGIGLSLTKELVDMHRASILADSQPGHGTWFTVTFLLGTKHFQGDVDFIVEDGENPEMDQTPAVTAEQEQPDLQSDKQSILLVEDNKDLRSFLRTVLEKEFRIFEAVNGQEGIQIAFEKLPDIIISDVMMPGTDGLQLTEAIKADMRTSHTPVILLTARTAMEDKLSALSSGADDYITKPFSAEYLEARIRNLLQQRQKLQDLFRNNLSFEEGNDVKEVSPSVPKVVSQDDIFIENLIHTLEENMENSELTVDDLVSMAGLSRSVFFKKLKSLTGLAPIEFIREMRIKRAAQLIETRQYNISQVAYMVGMNDPRYFSRCFKQKYGMTPTEYKEQAAEVCK